MRGALRAMRPVSHARTSAIGDRPVAGIGLVVVATLLFSVSDLCVKLLSARLPVVEIAWLRYAIHAAAMLPIFIRPGSTSDSLTSASPALQICRGLLAVATALFFMLALQHLPIAEATATYFVSPILVTLVSVPLLGERVTARHRLGTLISFVGVMIVVQPGMSAFQPASLLALAAAASWAIVAVISRRIRGDRTAVTFAYTAFVGFLCLTAIVPFFWIAPRPDEAGAILGMAAAAATGHGLLVLAYKFAPISVLAPFSYSQIVWAGLLGAAVLGTLPGAAVVLGSLVICLGGVVVGWRSMRRPPAEPPSALPS